MERFCAHELEELILLNYPHYPKESTDSVQCLLISVAFLTNRTNNPKICIEL